ncbi:MAG: OmpP1/FadL family transporter [Thermoanaerobaculia bacterium]
MHSKPRVLAILLLFAASSLSGAGFTFFEQGAKATAMGGAFVATADDPSAMFYNVAGLAYQRAMEASVGATLVTFANEFTGDPESLFPGAGARAEYEDHLFVVPNTYLIVPVGTNATFAIGTFTPNALRTDWDDPNRFPGRFLSQDANIKSVSIQPSFAMKMAGDRFAWGAGIEYRTVHLSLERNQGLFNPFTGRIADIAHTRLDSDWSGELGFNVGALYRPNPTWSIGAQYRAPIDIEFDGDAAFTQIPTGNAQLDAIVAAQLPPDQAIRTAIEFPSIASVGIATTMIPEWTVELDVVHTGWSSFDELTVEFLDTPQNNLVLRQDWDDALSYRVGGFRALTPAWELRLGAVYDETPQPLSGAGPLLPDADRYGISFGLGYQCGPWSVDVTEFALAFAERDTQGTNKDNFNGTYETNANLVSVNIGYTF